MFTNQVGLVKKESAERIRIRSQIYKTLDSGFGQRIASQMSSNIVNTLENARARLSKFQG
jgi:hypothetical protein